jgi:hypothetical protein
MSLGGLRREALAHHVRDGSPALDTADRAKQSRARSSLAHLAASLKVGQSVR